MALDQIVTFQTKEGYQYLIEFAVANEVIALPESICIEIVDVAITQIAGDGINNPMLFL